MTQKLQVLRSKKLWITLLVIMLIAQTLLIVNLFRIRMIDMRYSAEQDFNIFAYHGRQDAYRPVTVDGPSDRVYFPEMKFSVPFSHTSRDWLYGFSGDIGSKDSSITLTNRQMIDSYNNSSYPGGINEFGGCSLLVEVGFVGGEAMDEGGATVDLEDGRQLSIIRHDDGVCQNRTVQQLIDETTEQLKLAESY